MALAVLLIVLVLGSLLFHFFSPWYFTPLASNWGLIDFTVDITFVVTGIVFVAANLFMAYCLIRFRHTEGRRADYEPENTKLELWLTAITTVGVIAMLAPGLVVWGQFVTVPEEAAEFEAVGQQWHWSFRFPGEDNVFGDVSVRHITENNALALTLRIRPGRTTFWSRAPSSICQWISRYRPGSGLRTSSTTLQCLNSE